ncbi:MAG: VPS10 domain-containing protein, partial [Acidobacteriota bacterium]
MRKLLSLALLFVLFGSARAESLDDILAKNYAARGGDKLRAIQSIRYTGHLQFGGFGGDGIELAWGEVLVPGKIRNEVTLQGMTAVMGYDGRDGWNVQPFQGRFEPEKASADEARSMAQQAELTGPLIDYKAKGHRIEYLGTEDVDGTQAWKLRVTRRDGDIQYVYLDPDSALEIRITTVHKVRGTEEITETDLGEYAQVAGAWFPFALESGPKGGPKTIHALVERAEANVAVDDGWFRVPTARVQRVIVAGTGGTTGAEVAAPPPTGPVKVDSGTISGLGARNIGSAAMSGRVAAVAAATVGGKTLIYVGAASGGVWRSQDGGTTFKPVFDKQPVQSIGAIAIDPSNPRNVWVGTGEAWTRNSVSVGNGIYRSTDGGETWTHVGLDNSERVARILVHPTNGNIVYACVPGRLWSDSRDRGLYKTTDGGRTWTLVLAGSNLSTGCSSVTMDPRNPEVLFAGMWDFRRKGWTFRSGGDGPNARSGSGLYRTTDGGRTWQNFSAARGLTAMPWGRVEVAIAPSDPKIVYALIESKSSALFRSADGGYTWEPRDKSSMMVWRPFYFARLVIDPTNPNRLFKPDGGLIVSEDGGRSFSGSGGGSHGDWHDVWIDPHNPKHVIGGDDGGFWLSFDGGTKWFKENNLPISQFYHVSVDDKDPYQVYGGLQDNSSWVGDSAYPGGITNQRWENLCNSDGFWTIVDPTDANAVYCEGQGGYIIRVDRKTLSSRDIQPKAGYHEKLRFNWNTPIAVSPTRKNVLYLG